MNDGVARIRHDWREASSRPNSHDEGTKYSRCSVKVFDLHGDGELRHRSGNIRGLQLPFSILAVNFC